METLPVNRPEISSFLSGFWKRFDAFLRRPIFAYATIALLQLLAIRGIWTNRDITAGDTPSYFSDAYSWYDRGEENFAWSPLYTTYYGSLLYVSPDPCVATLLHRVIIIFAATLMVLVLARRLLPPAVAWLVAAWWTVLPINFNTLYEVHLFAVLPVLASWCVISARNNRWCRGAGLAILCGSAVLVRNEITVAALLFSLVCLWREWQGVQALAGKSLLRSLAATVAAYLAPLVATALVVLFYYQHSYCKFDGPSGGTLYDVLRDKHELNMAQVFAYGYHQRHPEWKLNPWTEYAELMTRFFGKAKPSLSLMLRANPRSTLAHVLWNFELAPGGLQLLLFNGMSGKINPDYADVLPRSGAVRIATIVVLILWAVGLFLLLRHRRAELARLVNGRGTVWLAMLCVAAVAVPVIATQRPRPSYLFPLGILMMTFTGLCVAAIVGRFEIWRRYGSILPLVVLACYFFGPYRPPYAHGTALTPLSDTIHRLQPFASLIGKTDTRFVKGEYLPEVRIYVGHGVGQLFDYQILFDCPPETPLGTYLERKQINLVYFDETRLKWLESQPEAFSKDFRIPGSSRWKLIGAADAPAPRWRLYHLELPAS